LHLIPIILNDVTLVQQQQHQKTNRLTTTRRKLLPMLWRCRQAPHLAHDPPTLATDASPAQTHKSRAAIAIFDFATHEHDPTKNDDENNNENKPIAKTTNNLLSEKRYNQW
jgi:hypothetical protein